MDAEIVESAIRVQIHEHAATNLLVAKSVDLPGLVVAALSIEQIDAELPGAIREVFEAMGRKVISVEGADDPDQASGFVRRSFIANAKLVADQSCR